MKHHIIAILILYGSAQALSQSTTNKEHLSIISYGGLLFPGYTNWIFYDARERVSTKPDVAVSIGVQYGPLVSVNGTLVQVSLEAGFGQMRTADYYQGANKFEMVIQRLPIMLWFSAETDNVLTPYVRIGSGIVKTDFRETFTDTYYPNIRFHSWNFCWGWGAGLQYRCSNSLLVSIFVDNWITEEKIVRQDIWGNERGIYGPYGDHPAGLRVTIYP